jgi:hypothetical protein
MVNRVGATEVDISEGQDKSTEGELVTLAR